LDEQFGYSDAVAGNHREGEGDPGVGEAANFEPAIPPLALAQPNASSMRLLIR
jgi:hypothetical protein